MKTLEDEKQLISCRPSYRAALPRMILPLALLVSACWLGWIAAAFAALWLVLVLIRATWERFGEKYVVTNRRVVTTRGIFSTATTEVRVSDIRAVFVRKSIVGRLFGYANIAIGSAAVGDVEVAMRDIADADAITQTIERLRAASS